MVLVRNRYGRLLKKLFLKEAVILSKAQAISSMQTAIIRYIDSKIPKNSNQAQTGIIKGNKVLLTNGRTYLTDPITDIYYGDGSKVACLIPDGSNTAAVVGVFA